MNKLVRIIGGDSAPYVDFVEAYRLEEIGFCPENCSACYYTTAATANETPRLEYVSDLMRGSCVSELVLTAAPTLIEAAEFIRSEFKIYITAFPVVKVDEASDKKAYRHTGKFKYRYNEFIDGAIATMSCPDGEYDSYPEALEAGVKAVTEYLYSMQQPKIDPIFGDEMADGSNTPF